MTPSITQYLQLNLNDKVSLMKKTFVAKEFQTIDGRTEPVLVEEITGERLFGGIYVTHLMTFAREAQHQQAGLETESVDVPASNPPPILEVVPDSIVEVQEPTLSHELSKDELWHDTAAVRATFPRADEYQAELDLFSNEK